MPLARIEKLLKETMGLNAASIGSSAINRAVQQRMRERNIEREEDYLVHLRASALELQQLIDQVIIPETWFFRDHHPFVALTRYAQGHWRVLDRTGPLRVLSAPSSTGEEPYSIAMTLLDAGLKPGDFHIDAIDISEPNLQRARAGLYREYSFRGETLEFRSRYFLPSEQGYLLRPEIRDQVRFQHANLLAPGFCVDCAHYDVVFCRNLLIYFDRATQAQALQVLERLLHPKGILFLGHAEAGVMAGRDFSPLDHPRSFAFVRGRKKAATEYSNADTHNAAQTRRRALTTPQQSAPKYRPFATVSPVPAVVATPVVSDHRGDLDAATRLADEGHMAEAATVCATYLQQHGPDVQAFYLLAMVREAVGEPAEAEALLRKALYLDPNHYEALTHLTVLLEQRGDTANAELVHQRALRSHGRVQNEAAQRADNA